MERKEMKTRNTLLTVLLFMFSTTVFATGYKPPATPGSTTTTTTTVKQDVDTTAVGIGVGLGIGKANAKAGAYSDSESASVSGAINGGSTSGVEIGGTKYPNQAPPIIGTSAPSFSQRNCTPVGSVQASGPFGGIGVALPMGGDICNGLNVSDLVHDWQEQLGDARLWAIQCNYMLKKDDDLADAFEEQGLSCNSVYNEWVVKVNANAKMAMARQKAIETPR